MCNENKNSSSIYGRYTVYVPLQYTSSYIWCVWYIVGSIESTSDNVYWCLNCKMWMETQSLKKSVFINSWTSLKNRFWCNRGRDKLSTLWYLFVYQILFEQWTIKIWYKLWNCFSCVMHPFQFIIIAFNSGN